MREIAMADSPWKDKTWANLAADQRIEFLNQWCTNLSNAVRSLEEDVRSLRETLHKVEDKAKGPGGRV
jgi:fructosamine-3-kinase